MDEPQEADLDRLLRSAEALIEANRGRDALAVATEAIGIGPTDARGYCAAARALLSEQRHVEAAEMALAAIRRQPTWALPFRIRSLALIEASTGGRGVDHQRLHDAVVAATEAVRLAPNDHLCLIAAAQAYARAGDHLRAHDAMQRAISLAPERVSTWVTASVVAVQLRDWVTTEQACRRALEIDPMNYAALNNLGLALRGLGQRKAAASAFAAAASANPRSSTARRNLARTGAAYLRIGLLVVLAPLVLIHDGFYVYLAAAIATNLAIYFYPGFIQPLERWTAPLALRIARGGRSSGSDLAGPEESIRSRRRFRVGLVVTWAAFVALLVGLAVALVDGSSFALVFVAGLLVLVLRLRAMGPVAPANRQPRGGGSSRPL